MQKFESRRYCCTHETWLMETMVDGECLITSCPPPEVPQDWELHLTEPDSQELAQMDLNARELVKSLMEQGALQ